jgi:hypothetical protein
LRFFDLTPTGRALNRCLKDMATIDDRCPAAVDMATLSGKSWKMAIEIVDFPIKNGDFP